MADVKTFDLFYSYIAGGAQKGDGKESPLRPFRLHALPPPCLA